jgi:predicted transcriptional regulator
MIKAFCMTPKAFHKVRKVILELEKPSTATYIFKQSRQNYKAIKLILSILVRKKELLRIETNTDAFYYPLNKTHLSKTLEKVQNMLKEKELIKENESKTKKTYKESE